MEFGIDLGRKCFYHCFLNCGCIRTGKQALQDIVAPELKALQGEIKSVRVEITSETWKIISLTTPPVKQSQTTMCLFRTLFIK